MNIEMRPLLNPDKFPESSFKTRVQNYGQKCIILVHPFLPAFTKPYPKDYTTYLDEVLKRSLKGDLPLVIAEESGPAFQNLPAKLSEFGKGTFFAFPTRPQSPRPELPFDWQDLKNVLTESGVKTAQIGGQRFEFASIDEQGILDEHPYADWLIDQMYDGNQSEVISKRVLPFGCGGMMICELMTAGINIELLIASYPSNKIALPENRIVLPA